MLPDLRRLGRILIITCNPGTVIGRYQPYPALTFHHDHNDMAHGGGLSIDLNRWSRANAWEQRESNTLRYTIEISDTRQEPIHRVCLTPESDFPEFVHWVKTHQGFNPGPAHLAKGFPRHPEIGPMRKDAILSLLHRLMELKMRVRVSVGNAGVSQSHTFEFQELRERGNCVFCAGEETAWHILPERIDCLLTEMCRFRGAYRLRGLDRDGTTLFALSPGREANLTLWNRLAVETAEALAPVEARA